MGDSRHIMYANYSLLFTVLFCGGCVIHSNDTSPEGDADTDDDVYATVVARTDVTANFDIEGDDEIEDDDEYVCEGVTECRMDVPAPDTYQVYAKAASWVFGYKVEEIDKPTDTTVEWGEGQWGADFSGTFDVMDDSGELIDDLHEVEVSRSGEFVKISLGLPIPEAPMNGLGFGHDDGDTWSDGYGTANLDEIFVEYGSYESGNEYSKHFVRVD